MRMPVRLERDRMPYVLRALVGAFRVEAGSAGKKRTPPPLPDTGFIWWAREVSNL